MCYAYSLESFAKSLRAFAARASGTADFWGSQDLELHIGPNPSQADYDQPMPPLRELRYENFVQPMGTTELRISLGAPEEPLETAKAIERVITTLEMDCSRDPDYSSHGPLETKSPQK